MGASDFFEDFLLHNGSKRCAPKKIWLSCFCLARDDTTGGYSANGCLPFVGPWWAFSKPAGGGVSRPRLCQTSLCRKNPPHARKQRVPCEGKFLCLFCQMERRPPGVSTSRARICSSVVWPSQCCM